MNVELVYQAVLFASLSHCQLILISTSQLFGFIKAFTAVEKSFSSDKNSVVPKIDVLEQNGYFSAAFPSMCDRRHLQLDFRQRALGA